MEYSILRPFQRAIIGPEACFDIPHLNNAKGTKQLSINIKFALDLKTKAFLNKRNHQSHIKRTESIAKPHPSDRAHTTPTTVENYAKKVKGNSFRKQHLNYQLQLI